MAGRVEDRLARRGGPVELLRLPAWAFGVAARLRGALYDRRLITIEQLDTPVISVGNLTAGGTGKTPMVAWVVRALEDLGRWPGVLSRGYGRGPESANEEAQMLARLLPGVPHVQDPDRVAGGARLQARGVDVIVLDDGFQHRRLARDLDLVLVDATRPWGLPAAREGAAPVCALLPRGLLRERPTALARADLVVLTRADSVDGTTLAGLRAELARHAPRAPLVLARHAPRGLRAMDGAAADPTGQPDLAALAGDEVDLLSGVGNPTAFEATLRALGATVVEHRAFPDHHRFTSRDLADLGARRLVVTAKDEPKLAALERPADVWVLDVELELLEGEEVLRERLAALPQGQRGRERRALHEGLHG